MILKAKNYKSEVLKMKLHTIKLNQVDMLCGKCVLRVLKALSSIKGIVELDVDLNRHQVLLKHRNPSLSKQNIQNLINNAIFAYK